MDNGTTNEKINPSNKKINQINKNNYNNIIEKCPKCSKDIEKNKLKEHLQSSHISEIIDKIFHNSYPHFQTPIWKESFSDFFLKCSHLGYV